LHWNLEGIGMTKKKYEAPVLRKAGRLSSQVAGGVSKVPPP